MSNQSAAHISAQVAISRSRLVEVKSRPSVDRRGAAIEMNSRGSPAPLLSAQNGSRFERRAGQVYWLAISGMKLAFPDDERPVAD